MSSKIDPSQNSLTQALLETTPPRTTTPLRKTGTILPVLISITHPVIQGHWIVVDKVETDIIYLRDPHTGRAYAVDKDTFLTYLDPEGIERCLSVK